MLVGNPDIVDAVVRTKNTAYLFARAIGQTNIFFFDANGQQILSLDLEVAQDMAALQKLIQRTMPGTRDHRRHDRRQCRARRQRPRRRPKPRSRMDLAVQVRRRMRRR